MRTERERAERWKDQMVLLALYLLADGDGLYCHATDRQIADIVRRAGVGAASIPDRLWRLGEVEDIGLYIRREHGRRVRRIIVLSDHPDAKRVWSEIEACYRESRQIPA